MTSLPLMICLMARCWMADGFSNPAGKSGKWLSTAGDAPAGCSIHMGLLSGPQALPLLLPWKVWAQGQGLRDGPTGGRHCRDTQGPGSSHGPAQLTGINPRNTAVSGIVHGVSTAPPAHSTPGSEQLLLKESLPQVKQQWTVQTPSSLRAARLGRRAAPSEHPESQQWPVAT